MINLLPVEEKKFLEKEYKRRRLAVRLIVGIVLVVLTFVVLAPSYMLARMKAEDQITNGARIIKKSNEADSKTKIENAKSIMKVLTPRSAVLSITELVSILTTAKTENIKLKNISYNVQDDGSVNAIIQGIAKNRAALSVYSDALHQEKRFSKVDFPVSNFAKDSNINFSFTVVVNAPEE
jgi:Tfp pilus assembly protein PilN